MRSIPGPNCPGPQNEQVEYEPRNGCEDKGKDVGQNEKAYCSFCILLKLHFHTCSLLTVDVACQGPMIVALGRASLSTEFGTIGHDPPRPAEISLRANLP